MPIVAKLDTARTVLEALSLRAREEPQGVWFTLCGETVTYEAARAKSLRYAAGLARAGLGRGDAVCLVLPARQEFFYAFFGAQALGAVPVPLHPARGAEPLGRTFRDSGARAVITIDWFRATVEEAWKESVDPSGRYISSGKPLPGVEVRVVRDG